MSWSEEWGQENKLPGCVLNSQYNESICFRRSLSMQMIRRFWTPCYRRNENILPGTVKNLVRIRRFSNLSTGNWTWGPLSWRPLSFTRARRSTALHLLRRFYAKIATEIIRKMWDFDDRKITSYNFILTGA